METKPDTIKISTTHQEEISATHADLHVTVRGSSIFSGSEAMKKAKEVSQLVEALTSFGVKSEAVTLQGVHVETAQGINDVEGKSHGSELREEACNQEPVEVFILAENSF